MHPLASRLARRFSQPALVFNLNQQFDRLNDRGQLEAFKRIIRRRDTILQGSVNPALFNSVSQARQYAGRAVDKDWLCPLRTVAHRG